VTDRGNKEVSDNHNHLIRSSAEAWKVDTQHRIHKGMRGATMVDQTLTFRLLRSQTLTGPKADPIHHHRKVPRDLLQTDILPNTIFPAISLFTKKATGHGTVNSVVIFIRSIVIHSQYGRRRPEDRPLATLSITT
jgi:hypothetical protein